MKRIFGIVCVAFILLVTGCSNTINKNPIDSTVDEKFMVYSIPWGELWEDVKDKELLKEAKVIADDGNRFAVKIEEAEFLKVKGKMVLHFSVSENSFPNLGLIKVYFGYDDKDEKALLEQGKKLYGKRKEFFLDKNGIENPLNPSAWYSEESIDENLTEKERAYFLKILKERSVEETRADAIMRGPLVVISVHEDRNMIEISGDNAAKVKNLRNAVQK